MSKRKYKAEPHRPTRAAWYDMHYRCYNTEREYYKDYGGAGIRVCERWHNYDNFVEDMGYKPDGMTLDRINNDGDYTPENCRWADRLVQARNRRSNTLITHNGKTQCLAAWAEELGINIQTLCSRWVRGYPLDRVLSTDNLRKPTHG